MGTIKKGILGGFHGKVGTVVGGSWKGVTYMRGMAPSIRNPRTEGQIRQRDKIRNVSAFLQVMLPVINVGYKNSAAKQSPYSAAMSHILKNAMSGDAVDYTAYCSHAAHCPMSGTSPPPPTPPPPTSPGATRRG